MTLVQLADAAQCPDKLGRIERRFLARFGARHKQHFCYPSIPVDVCSLCAGCAFCNETCAFGAATAKRVGMTIWQSPQATLERPHGLKYSLFYGRGGKRIVGYDNERGQG